MSDRYGGWPLAAADVLVAAIAGLGQLESSGEHCSCASPSDVLCVLYSGGASWRWAVSQYGCVVDREPPATHKTSLDEEFVAT
eukprot:6008707-Amphidinium_carterae.2